MGKEGTFTMRQKDVETNDLDVERFRMEVRLSCLECDSFRLKRKRPWMGKT